MATVIDVIRLNILCGFSRSGLNLLRWRQRFAHLSCWADCIRLRVLMLAQKRAGKAYRCEFCCKWIVKVARYKFFKPIRYHCDVHRYEAFLIDFDINIMTSSPMIYFVTSSPKVALIHKLYVNEKRKLLDYGTPFEWSIKKSVKYLGLQKLGPWLGFIQTTIYVNAVQNVTPLLCENSMERYRNNRYFARISIFFGETQPRWYLTLVLISTHPYNLCFREHIDDVPR